MPFSSLHFLFLFLPVFLVLYFSIPVRWWRNGILLLGSLFFYAWGNSTYLILIIISIFFNWLLALFIDSLNSNHKHGWAVAIMIMAVCANLVVLLYYRYVDFLIENLNALLKTHLIQPGLPVPLGLSFFILTSVAYLVDVYRGEEVANRNIIQAANYLAMFPKIIAGPITRYGQLEAQLMLRSPSVEDVAEGIRRFIYGLAKKILIADNLAMVSDAIFSKRFDLLGADLSWYGLIAFTLMIYFDLSGYTDMAIGLGRILGFQLPENFYYPYISRSITDFWRRWHISLTTFFHDYLIQPSEMSHRKGKFFRQQVNRVIVLVLFGLWHGDGWNFVLWGCYLGILLVLEASFLGKLLKKVPGFLQHLYTIIFVVLGWVIFRVENVQDWGPFFSALFGGHGWTNRYHTMSGLNIFLFWPLLVLAVLLSTPIMKSLWDKACKHKIILFLSDIVLLVLFIISVASIVANGYTNFLFQ